MAGLVAGIGAINFLTAVRPSVEVARLATPVDGTTPGRAQMFVLGILLLTVARGLIHRRFAAWIAGIATLGFAIAVTVPEHRPYATLLAGAALVALVALRRAFVTRPDPARIRLASQLLLVAIGIAIVGGAWDAVAERHTPTRAGRLLLADLSTRTPDGWRAAILTFALAAAVIAAVMVAFAPAAAPADGNATDRNDVADLVAHGDVDSLAPFATRADKAYVFDPSRQAAIGYRVFFGTALIGGDPVGTATHAPEAVRAYLDLCRKHGWRPAVIGASDAMRALWRTVGLRGIHIGDEAILDVETFSLASRRMRNLRQAVSRTRNAGVTVTIGRLDAALAAQLQPILAYWLHGARERGFAMNLDAILIPRRDSIVATAYAKTGEPVAFARFAIGAAGRTFTLDVAPRGQNAPNGVAERLIIEVVDYARAQGAREVSLNFAGLRWVFESPGLIPRLGATMLHALDRWIEVGPLNRFSAKFAPQWRPRSLLMGSWWEIGWVAAAALRAELGPGRVPDAGLTSAAHIPAQRSAPESTGPTREARPRHK